MAVRTALLVAIGLFLSTVDSHAGAERLGLSAPLRVEALQRELVLNGEGRRIHHWIVAYGVALYLLRPSTSLEYVMDEKTPALLRVHVVSNLLRDRIPRNWIRGLGAELPRALLGRFVRAYKMLKAGDIVHIMYAPGAGTSITANGRRILSVPGRGLMNFFLDHWVGPAPVSPPLRAALLGEPPAKGNGAPHRYADR